MIINLNYLFSILSLLIILPIKILKFLNIALQVLNKLTYYLN